MTIKDGDATKQAHRGDAIPTIVLPSNPVVPQAMEREDRGGVTSLPNPISMRSVDRDPFSVVITKPSLDSKTGLGFRHNQSGYVILTRVSRDGLAAQQTADLTKNMRILQINGTDIVRHMPISKVQALIREAEGEVVLEIRETASSLRNFHHHSSGRSVPTAAASVQDTKPRERQPNNEARKRGICDPYFHDCPCCHCDAHSQSAFGEACYYCCICCQAESNGDKHPCCQSGCEYFGDGCQALCSPVAATCDGCDVCCQSGCSALADGCDVCCQGGCAGLEAMGHCCYGCLQCICGCLVACPDV